MIELCEPPLDLGAHCKLTACRYDKDSDIARLTQRTHITLPQRLHSAVNKRKVEFICGRHCAAQGFHHFNGGNVNTELANAIKNAEDRSPIWPEGYVGAITHSHSFAAAAVAQQHELRSVGIDSEQLIKEKTASAVKNQILTNEEVFSSLVAQGLDEREYLTVIFSAKESIYKCLHPLVKQFFGFDAAQVTLDFASADVSQHPFRFKLLKPLNEEFSVAFQGQGHWTFKEGFAHTAVLLPR